MSDRSIRESIRAGASTIEAIREDTGAAECCGGCEPLVSELLEQELGGATGSSARPSFRPLRVVRDTRAA